MFEHIRRAATDPGDEASVKRRVERMRDYADRFMDEYEKLTAKVRKEYGGDFGSYRKARDVSYQHNMERMNKGLGMVGTLAPTNIFVNKTYELDLLSSLFNPQQQRLIWYGKSAI